ncbi:hypothetical protein OEZ85_011054 [Tetradesmus obliquus]|uniref:Methyltransferase FkbM domain-containing protein n=1 Tax=Tetradesmus obliquus TaxID=3088 RepID=A0ABY8TP42_TETOB|nr:hypothetical protein OEZ85_011054 [Tetradesmus obliquus]
MPTTVTVTRPHNLPYLTSNVGSIRLEGNLHVTQDVNTTGNVGAYDLRAANTLFTNHLVANSLEISEALTGSANITLDNYLKANYTFANISTYGKDLAMYANTEAQVYVTNSIRRSVHGSIWLGNSNQVEVSHDLDIEPNLYTVITTLCDAGSTTQISVPQVINKAANSFQIVCVPENSSQQAMVNFMIIEEAVQRNTACSVLPIEILIMDGMSSVRTRLFYNMLLGLEPPVRYLEVGVFKGSSLVSALYRNPHVEATCIDNWSEFNGPAEAFRANVAKYLPDNRLTVIERDCFEVQLPPNSVDVFMCARVPLLA